MRQLRAVQRHVVEAVDRAQQRGPAGVVEQAGEVAVERIEDARPGEDGAQARLAVGVLPDLRRRTGREGVALGVEDRPEDDVGDRPAQALGADHRHRAGEVDLAFVVAALERARRAADDLGGEHGVLRDPAGDVDRRIALVAQRLHQLRDRRAARAAAGWREACRRRSPRRAAPSGAGRRGRAGRRCRRCRERRRSSGRSGSARGSESGSSSAALSSATTSGAAAGAAAAAGCEGAGADGAAGGDTDGAPSAKPELAGVGRLLRVKGFHQRPSAMGQARDLRQAEYGQRRRARQIRRRRVSRWREALPARAVR